MTGAEARAVVKWAAPSPEATTLRVGRTRDPHAALGAAVQALMGAPAFARQPFGAWSRVLVGQINRRHYALARRGGRTVGFVGYGRCEEEAATRWLTGGIEPSSAECRAGPLILINAWAAQNAEVSAALRTWLHRTNSDAQGVVAKRFYPDGRMRPVRLTLQMGHVDLRASPIATAHLVGAAGKQMPSMNQ